MESSKLTSEQQIILNEKEEKEDSYSELDLNSEKEDSYSELDLNSEDEDEDDQRYRTDLTDLYKDIEKGTSKKEIFDKYPREYIKYNRRIINAIENRVPERERKTIVLVLYGKSGSGKNKLADQLAQQLYGESVFYKDKKISKFWDGYNGEKCTIIKNYNSQFKVNFIRCLLDIFPVTVEVRGSCVEFCSELCIITSKYHSKNWYSEYKGLHRRIELEVKVSKDKLKLVTYDVVEKKESKTDMTSQEIEDTYEWIGPHKKDISKEELVDLLHNALKNALVVKPSRGLKFPQRK